LCVNRQKQTSVTVENCSDKGYTVVNLRCPDRPKLLFDTVCTLTDMQYVVYHATVIAEGPEAYQVLFNFFVCFSCLIMLYNYLS
jgi:UTP:GlnB (protein PII) uridylyltransferase